MPTPLYDRLVELSHQPLTRLDMPGHHGRPAPGLDFWPAHLDVTEHPAKGGAFPRLVESTPRYWLSLRAPLFGPGLVPIT